MKPAYFNLDTGKIEGCRENSPAWWHELGHKVQENKTGLLTAFALYKDHFIVAMAIGAMAHNGTVFFAGFLLYVLPLAYFEIWAWAYAFRNRGAWK